MSVGVVPRCVLQLHAVLAGCETRHCEKGVSEETSQDAWKLGVGRFDGRELELI